MPRGQGATYYEATQMKTFAYSKNHKICFGELSEKVSRIQLYDVRDDCHQGPLSRSCHG